MADTAKADPSLPKEIGGYTIVSRLGRGGIVDAYRATNVDRTVALRVVRKDTKVPWAKEAHDREIDILNTPMFTHARHIARCLTHGIDPVYGPWIATEFVDGMTLQDLLSKGTIPEDEAIEIVMAICDALEELAMANVIHRDLKPDNIMLVRIEAEQRWTVKLVDFNIAIRLGSIPNDGEGKIAGTPSFMSPEQCRGEMMTTMSDMFSLGCILFLMLTGRVPMADEKGNSIKTMGIRATAKKPPERPSDISEDVWNALESVLHPLTSQRVNPTAFKILLGMVRYRPGRKEMEATPAVSGVVEAPPHTMPNTTTDTLPPPPPPKAPPAGKLKQAASVAGILAILFLATVGALTLATNYRNTRPREDEVVVTTPSTEEEEDAGIPADASAPAPRRTRPPIRRTEEPRPTPPAQPTPTPRTPSTRRGTPPPPVAGATVRPNGNYRIPHPDDWNDEDVVHRRPAMCAAFRARGVQGELFHRFCDGW